MYNLKCVVLFVTVVYCLDKVESRKLPSYITPCYRDDPNLHDCLLKEANRIGKMFMAGVPEMGVPSLDPLELGDIDVMPGSGSLKLMNRGAVLTGLKNAKLLDINIDPAKLSGSCHMTGDSVVRSNYTIDGQLLVFPINGKGKSTLKMKNFDLQMSWEYEIYKGKDGLDYVKIAKSKNKHEVEKINIKMDGLFNNDKVLGETMNQFLNENWREIMKEIGPPSIEVVQKKIVDIFNNFYAQIPYDDLLPPTPK